jgi:hypothetical protein
MQRRTKRIMAAGLVAGTAVVGGGAAVAASQFGSGNDQQALVADAAGRLGVSPAQLSSALKQAFNDRVDAAVAAGQLTKAQGDAIKARATAGVGAGVPFFAGPGGERSGFGFEVHRGLGGPGDVGDVFGAAATYLQIAPATLKADLEKGQSLATVAKAQGKTTDGLKTAITTAVQTKLDTAVKNGDLTKTQETDIMSRFSSQVGDLINATPTFRGHDDDGPGFAPGSAPAPPAWTPATPASSSTPSGTAA